MRLLLPLLLALSACWVGPAYVIDEPPGYSWCEDYAYPDVECERYYVWVNQSYRYDGRWYGGRYVRREHVRPHRPYRPR